MLQRWECSPPTNEAQVQIPALTPYVCGLCLLSVISLTLRGFSPGSPVFLSPQKPTFPNSNSSRNQVDEKPLAGCATSKSLLLLFIIYLNSSAKLWNFTSAYKIFALFGHIILSYLMIFKALSLAVSMIWYDIHLLLFYQGTAVVIAPILVLAYLSKCCSCHLNPALVWCINLQVMSVCTMKS